jgi:hypothetical protein
MNLEHSKYIWTRPSQMDSISKTVQLDGPAHIFHGIQFY